ncbi:SUMO ligase siz1 [Terramyces sp. JEL0728]|nr:SUMO ligase siz1 [Terramyces sp. JEL0728]
MVQPNLQIPVNTPTTLTPQIRGNFAGSGIRSLPPPSIYTTQSAQSNESVMNRNIERLKYLREMLQNSSALSEVIKEMTFWCKNPLAYNSAYVPLLSVILVQIAKICIEEPHEPLGFYRLLEIILKYRAKFLPLFENLTLCLQQYRYLVGITALAHYDPRVHHFRSKLTEWVTPIFKKFDMTTTPQLEPNGAPRIHPQTPYSYQYHSAPENVPARLNSGAAIPAMQNSAVHTPARLNSMASASIRPISTVSSVRANTPMSIAPNPTNLTSMVANSFSHIHTPSVSNRGSYIPLSHCIIYQSGNVRAFSSVHAEFAVSKEQLKLGNVDAFIQLRCHRAMDSTERHDWPVNLKSMLLNGVEIPVQKKKYERTPDNLLGTIGTNLPTLVKPYLKEGKATLSIHFYSSEKLKEEYVFKIESFFLLVPLKALEYVKTRPHLVEMDELFNGTDDECMMVVESMPLALNCPLTMTKMKQPVRSTHCKHLNCFDLDSWISSYATGAQYLNLTCPVCSKHIELHTLNLDMVVRNIVDSTADNVRTVTIKPDGGWDYDGKHIEKKVRKTLGKTSNLSPAISVRQSNQNVSNEPRQMNAEIITRMWQEHDKSDDEGLILPDPPTKIVNNDYADATDISKILDSIFGDDDLTVEIHEFENSHYLSDDYM